MDPFSARRYKCWSAFVQYGKLAILERKLMVLRARQC